LAAALAWPASGSAARDPLTYGAIIDRVEISRPLVALTFDDGPREPFTSDVLDVLRDQGIRATFFLVGENARRYPELVRRIQHEGHAIGNHSWSHRSFSDLSPAGIRDEIERTDRLLRSITGERPWLLRPPYGSAPASLVGGRGVAAATRHLVVNWSVDVRDWSTRSPLRVAVGALRAVGPGSIVLLHDGGGERAHTVTATRWMVGHLAREGYELVTLPELLRASAAR
jgi:peptidoglycan/xylan/chitin deacetylase (PgdA/CDA1 family)